MARRFSNLVQFTGWVTDDDFNTRIGNLSSTGVDVNGVPIEMNGLVNLNSGGPYAVTALDPCVVATIGVV